MPVRISVIMGVYNCEETLGEALESLYDENVEFEVVVCDDGSTDGTLRALEDFAKEHKNVKVLRNERNQGLAVALNRCLAVAQGEYIARMDGDDISLPGRQEKEMAFLDEHPEYAIVSCPMIYFDERGEYRRGYAHGNEATIENFSSGTPFCHAPSMMRKEALMAVGGYSESKWLNRIEDYNLWTKMYAAGYKGFRLKEHLYMMRDDRNAARRRTLRSRINAIYAHWLGYRALGFSAQGFVGYAVRTLAKGLVPMRCYQYIRNRKYGSETI